LPAAIAGSSLEQLLAAAQPPSGVVFEIVEGEEDALASLIPKMRDAITRLRERYPQIEIAVVSHGREQFALQSRYLDRYADIHQGIRALSDEQVPVHVCGTHASWYDVAAEDFPAYVDVPSSGPAQIRHYQELGFVLIKIDSDD
jgi:intracellular sulfur oxidation DsrE/DsrF family protein